MSANNPSFFGVEREWLSKAKFAKLMDDYVSNPRPSDPKKTSTTNVRNSDKTFITLEMYNDMKRVLQGQQPTASHEAGFPYWVRNTFKLKSLPGGTTCIVRKEGNRNANKYIAIKEHLYDMIASAHEATIHGRRDAMKDKFKDYLYCPSRFVTEVIKHCSTCARMQPKKQVKTSARAIHVDSFLSKLQMDLIDFKGKDTANGDMRYILHIKDHRTKYSWAYPLPTKEASGVGSKLHSLFYEVGPPDELQSDNSKEFTADDMVNSIKSKWPTIKFITSSAYHPQSQGCVERGNLTLKQKLKIWEKEYPTKHWTDGLPEVVYSMNTTYSRPINNTPYRLVYGQDPRSELASVIDYAARTEAILAMGDPEGIFAIDNPQDMDVDTTHDVGNEDGQQEPHHDDHGDAHDMYHNEEPQQDYDEDVAPTSPVESDNGLEAYTDYLYEQGYNDLSSVGDLDYDSNDMSSEHNVDYHANDASSLDILGQGEDQESLPSDAYEPWYGIEPSGDELSQDASGYANDLHHPDSSGYDPAMYDDLVSDGQLDEFLERESKRKSGEESPYTDISIPDGQDYIILSDTERGNLEYENNGAYHEADGGLDDDSSKGHDEYDETGIAQSDVDMDQDGISTASYDISTRHLDIRETAAKSYDRSVEQIQKRLESALDSIPVYEVGDVVGVVIEKRIRTKDDPRHIPVIVHDKVTTRDGYTMYKVVCAYGAITRTYHARELVSFGDVEFEELKDMDYTTMVRAIPPITIKEALALMREKHSRSFIERCCHCKAGCKTSRCPCKKKNTKCTKHCHPDHAMLCSNVDSNHQTTKQHRRQAGNRKARVTKPAFTRPMTRALTRRETRRSKYYN